MYWPNITGDTWDEALSRSPLSRYGNWRQQWFEYWDEIGNASLSNTPSISAHERDIIRYLNYHRLLKPGDRVLDIGCGSGTFALPMARAAAYVTGIDPSGTMLAMLRSAASEAGMENVRSIRTTWEEYVPAERHDLVFSAFCPGVYDRQTLAKMERASARCCCYVTGDVSQFQLLSQLWTVITGERCTVEAWDIAHPVNFLTNAGRNPSVRRIRHRSIQRAPAREVIDEFASYFRAFVDLRQAEYGKIRRFIEARSIDGHILLGNERTTWVVSWIVPA